MTENGAELMVLDLKGHIAKRHHASCAVGAA